MTWGRYYWPIALIIISVMISFPEVFALATNHANTLSDYARYELNVSTRLTAHTLAWWASLITWLLAIGTLTPHIWWNWG